MSHDLFADNPDVDYTCTLLSGVPILVLQTTGPAMSASLLLRDFKALKVRHAFDPTGKPNMFLCFDGEDCTIPVLATQLDPVQDVFTNRNKNDQWVLALQVVVEGQKETKMWTTENGVTTLMTREGNIPHWICKMWEN